MTVLRAIDASGGFTDFSRKTKVIITRANTRKQEYEDCVKAHQASRIGLADLSWGSGFGEEKIW